MSPRLVQIHTCRLRDPLRVAISGVDFIADPEP
jgi:hypothetical protein